MVFVDEIIETKTRKALEVLNRDVGAAAYLFGSRVPGKSDQWSDIDLAVFAEGLERWDLMDRRSKSRKKRGTTSKFIFSRPVF